MSFRRRVEAAAWAGFSGMGFSIDDLDVAEATYGMTGMAQILDDNGIDILEFSITTAWWTGETRPLESLVSWMRVLRFAEQLRATTVKVSPELTARTPRADGLAAGMGRVSQQAAGVGARLGVHFLPWLAPTTVDHALALAKASGHANAGIVVDGWQVESLRAAHQDVAGLPLGRIAAVELSDGALPNGRPSRLDAVNSRRNCGEGGFRLDGLVGALRAAGFVGPWGVQVLSSEHRDLPVGEALVRAASAARTVLGIDGRSSAAADSLGVDIESTVA